MSNSVKTTSTSLARPRSKRTRVAPGMVLSTPAMVLLVVFFIVPLVLTAVMSLHNWPLFGDREFIGLDNYVRLFNDPVWRKSLWFTLLFTVAATAVTVLVGLFLALLLEKPRKGVGFFRTLFFVPVVVGMAASSFMWIYLINGYVGPLAWFASLVGGEAPVFLNSQSGAFGAILVMTMWKSAGMAMILFTLGLQGIPQEVYEAAAVDGATYWHRITRVTLPLLRPTLAIVLVMQMTQNFLAFDQFFLLTKGGPNNSTITAVYWTYNQAFVNFQLGYGAALAMVILVLLVVLNAVQLKVTNRQGDS